MTQTEATADSVRDFVVGRFATDIEAFGYDPLALADDFDLLRSGLLDSLGFIELVAELEEHFGGTIDFEELDPEQLTLLGPFTRYVGERANTGQD
jgi:acyl carrier protein